MTRTFKLHPRMTSEQYMCSSRFSSSDEEEDGSGSEEGDEGRRFWECENWSKCPWSAEPFDTRPHTLLKCGRCHMVRYCSKGCQRANWPDHRAICEANCLMEKGFKQDSTFAQGLVSECTTWRKDDTGVEEIIARIARV